MIIFFIFLFLMFLCWGSFLNVIAHRSITDISFFKKRSECPACKNIIAWYDNIPLISWFLLKAKCRNCKNEISLLYPFIELITAVVMLAVFVKVFYFYGVWVFTFKTIINFVSYLIFFSALIVATRTDLQDLVIPQIFSIWLAPFGIIFAFFDFIDISFWESFIGAIVGYAGLWLVAKIFKAFAKKDGLGVGDMELLAMIGAFLGPIGVWVSLFFGSILGLVIGSFYIFLTKQGKYTLIPFGPFLAFGALINFLFKNQILSFFL